MANHVVIQLTHLTGIPHHTTPHHTTPQHTTAHHHITTSPHHHITTSPHHHITTSPHHHSIYQTSAPTNTHHIHDHTTSSRHDISHTTQPPIPSTNYQRTNEAWGEGCMGNTPTINITPLLMGIGSLMML